MTQEEFNIETPKEEPQKQLVAIVDLKPKEVFNETGVTDLLEKVKELAKPKLDAGTPEGREERRTLAAQIARTKTGVDDMGKAYVGELKKVTTTIDARRKHWRDTMDGLKEAVRKPLTEYEDKEKARIATHKGYIQQMRDLMDYDFEPTSADIEGRIKKVTLLAGQDFAEFSDEAATVAENASGRLGEKLASVIKAEEDAAELEKLRAAAAAQKEKDRVAQVQKEADEKAAAKVQAELDAAKERAEVAEAKAAEPTPQPMHDTPLAQPAQASTAPPPPAPDNGADHKRAVNQSIVQALMDSCMLSENAAKAVVIEIARGKVPNTTINY